MEGGQLQSCIVSSLKVAWIMFLHVACCLMVGLPTILYVIFWNLFYQFYFH